VKTASQSERQYLRTIADGWLLLPLFSRDDPDTVQVLRCRSISTLSLQTNLSFTEDEVVDANADLNLLVRILCRG
jgi:hypothetical protein